jgi:mRNA-degrading endonuclease RelE of RelBE toxin-antitoxin system
MRKWLIRFANAKAADEAALLFEDQAIKAECQRLLKLLSEEDHPGKPKNPQLNVKHLEHDAPNWYRLRVDKYRIRITFSLVYGENERIIEYIYGEVIFDDTENYVGIQQIGQRNKHTYIEARRRWRKSRR